MWFVHESVVLTGCACWHGCCPYYVGSSVKNRHQSGTRDVSSLKQWKVYLWKLVCARRKQAPVVTNAIKLINPDSGLENLLLACSVCCETEGIVLYSLLILFLMYTVCCRNSSKQILAFACESCLNAFNLTIFKMLVFNIFWMTQGHVKCTFMTMWMYFSVKEEIHKRSEWEKNQLTSSFFLKSLQRSRFISVVKIKQTFF